MAAVTAGTTTSYAPSMAQTRSDRTVVPQESAGSTGLKCDNSLSAVFQDDSNTQVLLVKQFLKDSNLTLDSKPSAKTAARDLCMVKLNIGPGNPGPVGAPSTSDGIGVEIWLPAPSDWNKRIHIRGGGGFMGLRSVKSLTSFTGQDRSSPIALDPVDIANGEAAVSSITDGGHVSEGEYVDGSFGMLPDGSINKRLWQDFSERAVHEMTLVTKKLTTALYGQPARYAYFHGGSTGGRQALKAAQLYPDDFDGILSQSAAINFSRLAVSEIYPHIVMQRDLAGVPISPKQFNLVSSAAVSACDSTLNGRHDGFISDPAQCRYDPVKDNAVLCTSSGGTNATADCVSTKQAWAINKIWYGQTTDGSVPDPAKSNGYSDHLERDQIWYGIPRGSELAAVPGLRVAASRDGIPVAFELATHQLAMTMQRPALAGAVFRNATGNGQNAWKELSYSDLVQASARGRRLQAEFGGIDSDDPDLSRFKARGGKLLATHGLADELIPVQGSLDYYKRVADRMGGYAAIEGFYLLYLVPGMGHTGNGLVSGLPAVSPPANPPSPRPTQLYDILVAWVEKGEEPKEIVLSNRDESIKRPICPVPTKIYFRGGEPAEPRNYGCR